MMDIIYTVLYTHQKTKKAKTWQDGTLKLMAAGTKAVLYDDRGGKLDALHVHPSDVVSGEQLESDRYFIQVEECQQKVSSQAPSVLASGPNTAASSSASLAFSQPSQHATNKARADYPQASSTSAMQSLGGRGGPGLKRKRSGFIPPRVIRPRKAEDEADLLGKSVHGNFNPVTSPTVPARVEKQADYILGGTASCGGFAGQKVDLGSSPTRSFSSSHLFSNSRLSSSKFPAAFSGNSNSDNTGICSNAPPQKEDGFGLGEAVEEKPESSFRSPECLTSRLTSVVKNSPWRTFGAKPLPGLQSSPLAGEAVDRTGREMHSGGGVSLTRRQMNSAAGSQAERSSAETFFRPPFASHYMHEKVPGEQKQFPENPVQFGSSKPAVKRSTSEIMALLGRNKTGAAPSLKTSVEKDILKSSPSHSSSVTCISKGTAMLTDTSPNTVAEDVECTSLALSSLNSQTISRVISPGSMMIYGSANAGVEKSPSFDKRTAWAELSCSTNSVMNRNNSQDDEILPKNSVNTSVADCALSPLAGEIESRYPAPITSSSQHKEKASNVSVKHPLHSGSVDGDSHPGLAPEPTGTPERKTPTGSNTTLPSPAVAPHTLKSYAGQLTDKRSYDRMQECLVDADSTRLIKKHSPMTVLSSSSQVSTPGDVSPTVRSHAGMTTFDSPKCKENLQECPLADDSMSRVNKPNLTSTEFSPSSWGVSRLAVSPQLSASTTSLCKNDFEEQAAGDFDEGLSHTSVSLNRAETNADNSQSLSDFDFPVSQHDAERQVSHSTSTGEHFASVDSHEAEMKLSESSVNYSKTCSGQNLSSLGGKANKTFEGRELNVRSDEESGIPHLTSSPQPEIVHIAEKEKQLNEGSIEEDFSGCFEMSFSPLPEEAESNDEPDVDPEKHFSHSPDAEDNTETSHVHNQDVALVDSTSKPPLVCSIKSPGRQRQAALVSEGNCGTKWSIADNADIAEHWSGSPVVSSSTDGKKSRPFKAHTAQVVTEAFVTDLPVTCIVDSANEGCRQQDTGDFQILPTTQGKRTPVSGGALGADTGVTTDKDTGKVPGEETGNLSGEDAVNVETSESQSMEITEGQPEALNTVVVDCGHPFSNSACPPLHGSDSQNVDADMRTLGDLDISPDSFRLGQPSQRTVAEGSQHSRCSECEGLQSKKDIRSCNSSLHLVNLEESAGSPHCENLNEQDMLTDFNNTGSCLIPEEPNTTNAFASSKFTFKSDDILESALVTTSPQTQIYPDKSPVFSSASGIMDGLSQTSSSSISDISSHYSVALPSGYKRMAVSPEKAALTKLPRFEDDAGSLLKQGPRLPSDQVEPNNDDLACDYEGRPHHLTTDNCRRHSLVALSAHRVFQTVSEVLRDRETSRQAARGTTRQAARETIRKATRETTRQAARERSKQVLESLSSLCAEEEDPLASVWRKKTRGDGFLPARTENPQHQSASGSALAGLPSPDQLIRVPGADLTDSHLTKPVDFTQTISARLTGYRMQGMVSGDMVQRSVASRTYPAAQRRLSSVPVAGDVGRRDLGSAWYGEMLPPACDGNERRQPQARNAALTPEARLFSPAGVAMETTDSSFFVDWQEGIPGLEDQLLRKQTRVSPEGALQQVPEFPDAVAMLKMSQAQRHQGSHSLLGHSHTQLPHFLPVQQSPTQSDAQITQSSGQSLKEQDQKQDLTFDNDGNSNSCEAVDSEGFVGEAGQYEAGVSEGVIGEADSCESGFSQETGDVISVSSDSQACNSRVQGRGRSVTPADHAGIGSSVSQENFVPKAAPAVASDNIRQVSSAVHKNPSKNFCGVSQAENMLGVLKEVHVKRASLSEERTSPSKFPQDLRPLPDSPGSCVRLKPALKGRQLKPVITEPDEMPLYSEVEAWPSGVGTDRPACTALSAPHKGLTAEPWLQESVADESIDCGSLRRSLEEPDYGVMHTSSNPKLLPSIHHHSPWAVSLEKSASGVDAMETEQADVDGFEDSFPESDDTLEQQLLAAEQSVTWGVTMVTRGDTLGGAPPSVRVQQSEKDYSSTAGLVEGAGDRSLMTDNTAFIRKDREMSSELQSELASKRKEPAAVPSAVSVREGGREGQGAIRNRSCDDNSSTAAADFIITDDTLDCVDEKENNGEALKHDSKHKATLQYCRQNSIPHNHAWSKAKRFAFQLQALNPEGKETHPVLQNSAKSFISHNSSVTNDWQKDMPSRKSLRGMPDMDDLLAPSSPTDSPPLDISPLRSSGLSSLFRATPCVDDSDMVQAFPQDSVPCSVSPSPCDAGVKGHFLGDGSQNEVGAKRPLSGECMPAARKVGLGKFRKPASACLSATQSGSNLCGELQFFGQEEVRLQATPERQVSIPASFASVASYRHILTAAITEFLNLQLFEVAKSYHCALSQVDVSGYTEGVSLQGKAAAESSNPPCRCGKPSKVAQVKKEGPNKGRFFYTCPGPRDKQCKFFLWVDQHNAKNSGTKSGGGPASAMPRFTDPDSIMGYFRSHSVALYCQCQFVRRCDRRSDKGFAAWGRSRQTDSMQKKNVFIKLSKKNSASMHGKDDLWVVSRSLSFARGETFVARSTFHGPNSQAEVAIDPLAGYSALQWSDGSVCHAIHCGNAATELTCMANLRDHVDLNSLPVLPYLLDLQSSVSASVRPAGRGFKAPQVTQVPGKLHIPPHHLHDLATDFASHYQLNVDQTTALRQAANMMNKDADPVTSVLLVHGVFGAGKSFLLSVLILFLVEVFQCNDTYSPGVPFPWKLLLSSTTNVAVDRVLQGLLMLGFEDFVRVGSVKKIAKPVLPYSVHSGGSESQELRDLQAMLKSADISPSEKHYVRKSIEKLRLGENRKRLGAVRVVGVTCAASSFQCLDKMSFPFVVLDECSQMTEPSSLLPIARFACHKLVLVGDPKQLDPTLQGSSSAHGEGLEQTLFDRLMKMGHCPVMLRTQYRCHPTISAVANSLFYHGQLINGVGAEDRAPVLGSFPSICFYDVSTGQDRTDPSGSFVNEAEAQFVVLLLAAMMAQGVGAGSVGVISLYKAQARRITDIINTCCSSKGDDQSQMTGVQVSTVDAFQGGERDIIILTCVRTGHLGFIDCDKRMNVALTRGRHHLLIVGHQRNLHGNRRWAQVISHCQGVPGGIMASSTARQQLQALLHQATDGNQDKSDCDLTALHNNAQSLESSQAPVASSYRQSAGTENNFCPPTCCQGTPPEDHQYDAVSDSEGLHTEPSPALVTRSRSRVKPVVVEDSEEEGSSDDSLPEGL